MYKRIIILLLAVLVCTACQKNNIDHDVTYNDCTLRCESDYYSRVSFDTDDESACEKASSKKGRTMCIDSVIFQKAVIENSEDLCQEITDNTITEICVNTILEAKDVESQYSVSCDSRENPEECINSSLRRFTLGNQDISLCEEISDEDEKIKCQDEVNMFNALINLDRSYCINISTNQNKILCEDEISSSEAIVKQDVEICNQIKTDSLRQQCFLDFVTTNSIQENDVNICNQAASESLVIECKDSYYYNSAFSEKDIKFCKKIIDEDLKEFCLAGRNNNNE